MIAVRAGLVRQSSALFSTPTTSLYWAEQARLGRQNSADSSRGEYQRVSQVETDSTSIAVATETAASNANTA